MPSIAYTYTDPHCLLRICLRYVSAARQTGVRNVLVTAGYCNPEPWRHLLEVTDAARIDLKGMNDDFYRKFCSGTVGPVQRCLVDAVAKGVHVEVINLIIPTLNDSQDDIRKLTRWIKTNLGSDIPLHFSRFFPQYKMQHLPPTPLETLDIARQIAMEEGLNYVYIGNIRSPEGENTYCPACHKMLIERQGFIMVQINLKTDAVRAAAKKFTGCGNESPRVYGKGAGCRLGCISIRIECCKSRCTSQVPAGKAGVEISRSSEIFKCNKFTI